MSNSPCSAIAMITEGLIRHLRVDEWDRTNHSRAVLSTSYGKSLKTPEKEKWYGNYNNKSNHTAKTPSQSNVPMFSKRKNGAVHMNSVYNQYLTRSSLPPTPRVFPEYGESKNINKLNEYKNLYNKFKASSEASQGVRNYRDRLLSVIRGSKKGNAELEHILQSKGPEVKDFYVDQNSLIDSMLFLEDIINPENLKPPTELESTIILKEVKSLVIASVYINILISMTQAYAAFTSNSLSLFATMCDSFMDLMSSGILLLANRLNENQGKMDMHSSGKSKIETLAVIIFSTVMGMLSTFLIFNSVEALLGEERRSNMSITNSLCILFAIACKMIFYFRCKKHQDNQSAKVLMMDSRNDFFVNSFGLTMALIGKHLLWWIDPLGCLLAALLIMKTWALEAVEKAQKIAGICADPEMIKLITFTAITHDPRITYIDDVRAYYQGIKLEVEVNIIMEPETPLIVIQKVSSTLAQKLERIPEVERVIVNVDYKARPELEELYIA
ncbi:hypothetical protein BB558_004509 [Smittium angustum]|uniref:Cation efflux protein transmembrane domain-containing protein n=1 Tax=Smittium angustum TaxID=133377 RepID=A0A2U1J336_SMIAN|nr:hypothetical protein BB558_004509 [Smittium angustum]